MSREELNRLIADDAYAASFQTMGQYRIALLKATDSAQDFARAQEWKNPLLSILTDAAKWLHAAYDRPPQTPEAKAMLDLIDLAIQFAGEVESYAAPAVAPEGCTPADALMLRAANHGLAAENDYLRRRLRPFAQIASSPLSWAMVEYCVDGDPEKQTLQAPQMQRAFNRAADALREHAAPAQAETHPLQCPHGGQCGVGGYCDDCPARSEQAEQQGDGGALTLEQYAEQNMLTLEEAADRWKPPEQPTARDYLDTLTAVLNAIGYTEEFAASHPDLKVSEGVKLFLALQRGAIECQAHIGPDCTECGGTGFWGDSTPATQSYAKPSSAAEGPNER